MNYDAQSQTADDQESLVALWLTGFALIAIALVALVVALVIQPAYRWWAFWVFAPSGLLGVLLVLTAAARPAARSGLRAVGMAITAMLLVTAMAVVLHWLVI